MPNLDFKTVASWTVVAFLFGFAMQLGNKTAEHLWKDSPIEIVDVTGE